MCVLLSFAGDFVVFTARNLEGEYCKCCFIELARIANKPKAINRIRSYPRSRHASHWNFVLKEVDPL